MPIAFEQLPPIGSPSGAAGGDLTGNYPNPTIGAKKVTAAKIADATITTAQLADPGTGKVIGSDGAGHAADVFPPGYELAYVQRTTNVSVTGTTAASPTDLGLSSGAITYDGTPVWIEFYAPKFAKGTSAITLVLYDGSTQLGNVGAVSFSASSFFARTRVTPSAGSHTYKWQAFVDAGTGTVEAGDGTAGNEAPAYIRVTKA